MTKDIQWAIKEVEGLGTESSQNYPHDEMIEKEIVLGILNQLDEPEVLSKEWIDENEVFIFDLDDDCEIRYVPSLKLRNLLVPKQAELEVKIQELIEAYKLEEDAYSNPENGWISGFIEDLKNLVEEEQKYIVVLGKSIYNTTTYGQIGEVNSKKIMQSVYANEESIIAPNQYTKSEILEVKDGEGIFKRFAV